MSIKAAGYVLHVPPDRRELLLEEAEHGGSYYRSAPSVAEPVPTFQHSRRAPLVVFASFEDGKVTHIADGKRGISAGTGNRTLEWPSKFSGYPKVQTLDSTEALTAVLGTQP